MKIAFVIERMDPSRGGRETSTGQVAAALAGRGHEVEILCRSGSWTAEGVTVRPLGKRGISRRRQLRNFVEDVRKTARRERYDIVHATLPVPGADVYQLRGGTVPAQRLASRRRRCPAGRLAAMLTRRLNFRRRLMAELERQVVGDKAVMCLAVSRMVAGELERYYNRTERVRVIFNAVDVPDPSGDLRARSRRQIREELRLGPEDIAFITVATNFELKGVTECIEAFSRWYNGDPARAGGRLIIVGRDRPNRYRRWAGLCGVGRQVVFVPHAPDIFEWYAASDVCVLLSWYDPCSRVVLEVVRWGIPPITTACNGAAEALADGAGVVVESPRDIEAVVAAMTKLAEPANRRNCSIACLNAAERLGMERHADELTAVYREILEAKC